MSFFRELYDRLCPQALTEEDNARLLSEEEDAFEEAETEAGMSLDREIECLVDELVAIGREEGFVSTSGPKIYDCYGVSLRAREIGKRLNDMGGLRLMKNVWWRVRLALSPSPASRDLDIIWNRIGEWRG